MTQAQVNTETLGQDDDAAVNVVDVGSIGRRAVELWKSSDRDGSKAEGLAIFALFQAWHTMTFNASVVDKKGAIEIAESFDLAEYINRDSRHVQNSNGTKNIKLLNARTHSIADKVFGISKPTNADKQRINRALTAVLFLANEGYDETQVQLSKRNNLVVPFPAMNDEPGDDASDNDKKIYASMEGETWEITGKQGNSLAELQRRAKPKGDSRQGSTGNSDKGQSFVTSIKFVSATIQSFLDEKAADDMPAPNKDTRKELFELQQRLAAYFKADPIEEVKSNKGRQSKAA